MKKTRIFTTAIGLCLAASMLAGCSQSSGETAVASRIEGGQTQISVEGSASPSTAEGYVFNYMGYDIIMGSDVQTYLDAFGEADDEFEALDCAGQGMAYVYSYPGFFIYTKEGIIENVLIEDSLTDFYGVHVGDTIDDARAAAKTVFGEPFEDWGVGFKYRLGNTELSYFSEDGETIYQIRIDYKQA